MFRDLIVRREANHVGMLSVRTLPLQDSFGIFHQRGVEKAETKIVPKGTEDRNVAVRVQVARVPPFDDLGQLRVEAPLAHLDETPAPPTGRAVWSREAFPAPATPRERLFDLGDHAESTLCARS